MRALGLIVVIAACGPAVPEVVAPPEAELIRAALVASEWRPAEGEKRIRVNEDVAGLSQKITGRLTPGTDVWRVMTRPELQLEADEHEQAFEHLQLGVSQFTAERASVELFPMMMWPASRGFFFINDLCAGSLKFEGTTGRWVFVERLPCGSP